MKKLYDWKQQGKFFMWKFSKNQKNFPGFHIRFDSEGRKSFKDLCCLLLECPINSYRTATLTPPQKDELIIAINGTSFVSKRAARICICLERKKLVVEEDNLFCIYFFREDIELILNHILVFPALQECKLGVGSDGINFW